MLNQSVNKNTDCLIQFKKQVPKLFIIGNLRLLNHLAESLVKERRSGADPSLCNNQCNLLSLNSDANMLRGLLWYPIDKCSSSLFLPTEASGFICGKPSLGMACGVRELSCRFAASVSFSETGLWVWKEQGK